MKNLPWKLLLSAVTLAAIFDILFYQTSEPGINVVLAQIAFIAITAVLAHHTKHSISIKGWIAASFATAFAATFAIWTSEIGLTISGFGLFFSNLFFFLFTLGHHGKFHHPATILSEGILHALQVGLGRLSIFTHFPVPTITEKNRQIATGLLILVPILIIFSALFLSSDLMLQDHATGSFEWLRDFFNVNNLIAHTFIIIPTTLVSLSFFTTAFWKRIEPQFIKELESKLNIESLIVLIGSSLLFLVFIIFQGFYLFGGQAAWDSIEAITYSEYAVQGFNELATVAILVIGLVLTLRVAHAEKAKNKLVPIFETILLSETVLILISAWIRLNLYVKEYGFTPARLFGFWFFIVTIALLVMLAVNILRKQAQYKFLQQSAIFLGITMLIFTMLAPDALSVRLNLARAEEQFDPFPLFDELSAEAYPTMMRVLTSGKYNIGLLSTEKTDYCQFIQVHYNNPNDHDVPNTIKSFTYKLNDDINNQVQNDFILRSNIHKFKNKWDKTGFDDELQGRNIVIYIPYHNWREWNASRAQLPKLDEYIPTNYLENVWSATEIANACGLHIGDVR